MPLNSRLRAFMLLCVCLLFAAPALASPSADTDGQFVLDKSTVVSGEPVWVTFRLVNHSTVSLHLAEAIGRGSVMRCEYGFLARDSAGQVISQPQGLMIISGPAHLVSVAPGKTYQKRLFLLDWLNLSRPGRYTLRCWQGASPGVAGWSAIDPAKDENKDAAGTVDLPLTVLPPDKNALGLVIQNLGKQAQSDDSAARDEAAISLAAISDPRIVPPLAALLVRPDPPGRVSLTDSNQTEDSRYSAVLGLSHFSTEASAEALLAAMNGDDDELRHAASDALKQMHYADQVLPTLRREMRFPAAPLRRAAIRAVASLQDPRGFAPLVNALGDRTASVRYEAAKALGALRDRRAVPVLRSHFHDPDLTLRLACIESLIPLKYPVLSRWLVPIVRSYAFPDHEHPALEAIVALRRDCGDPAALASCLHFDDPRPSRDYNFFLICQMDACFYGPQYAAQWVKGSDTPAGLENNHKILAAIKSHFDSIKSGLPAR